MKLNQNVNPHNHPGAGNQMDEIRWIAPAGVKPSDIVNKLSAHFPGWVFEVAPGGTVQHGAVYTSQRPDGTSLISVVLYKFTCANGHTCESGHGSVAPTAVPTLPTLAAIEAFVADVGDTGVL